jgi:hypothetical protein
MSSFANSEGKLYLVLIKVHLEKELPTFSDYYGCIGYVTLVTTISAKKATFEYEDYN